MSDIRRITSQVINIVDPNATVAATALAISLTPSSCLSEPNFSSQVES
jgi:hypothetical protein